jgi:hypothetical protein
MATMTPHAALRGALVLFAAALIATAAQANGAPGLFRAYLASTGNDANPCTLPQPCRLLPAALNAVIDGGEIWMLDSANYNTATVVVGKSVSILAIPGAVGSVVAAGGPAISITAGFLKIALRNVVIVPLPGGGGTDGINMTAASALNIEGGLIANLPGVGVAVTGTGKVDIASTVIRNNGSYGVTLLNGASANISGTKLLSNGSGGVTAQAAIATTTTATISDSVVSGGVEGVFADASIAGGAARIFLTHCTIEKTTVALNSQTSGAGTTVVAASNSMITDNNYAWSQFGAGSVVKSLGNNHIQDNTQSFGLLASASLQ